MQGVLSLGMGARWVGATGPAGKRIGQSVQFLVGFALAGNSDNAWNVNFDNGNDNRNNKGNNNRVRLVRGGE